MEIEKSGLKLEQPRIYLVQSPQMQYSHHQKIPSNVTLGSPRKDQITLALQKDILEQEGLLAKLRQRHRSILSVLGKCLNLQLCQIIDRRSLLSLDPFLQQRKIDKLTIVNKKKIENQTSMQELQQQISQKEAELLASIDKHKQQYEQLIAKKEALKQNLSHVHKQMKQMTNPSSKNQISLPYNALFLLSSPQIKKVNDPDESLNKENLDTFPLSKNNLVSSHQLFKRRGTGIPQISERKEEQNFETSPKKWSAPNPTQQQLITELNKMVGIVAKQETWIDETLNKNGSYLNGQTIEAMKRRKQGCNIKQNYLKQVLEEGVKDGTRQYKQWMREEAMHIELLRQLSNRSQLNQTITTIKTIKDM